jgi:hypothetical protein
VSQPFVEGGIVTYETREEFLHLATVPCLAPSFLQDGFYFVLRNRVEIVSVKSFSGTRTKSSGSAMLRIG